MALTFSIKAEEWAEDATVVGWSLTTQVDTAFGAIDDEPSTTDISVTGLTTHDNEDGTFKFVFFARGPDFDFGNLPAQGAITSIRINAVGEGLGDVYILDAANATYSQGGQEGSVDPTDFSATWTFDGFPYDPSNDLPMEDGIVYQVEVTLAEADDFNCECEEETNNETLQELRTRLLVRLGYAAQAENPPPGMQLLLDDFLRSAQRFLYGRYNALRTERFFTWTMEEGERFYDLPDNDDTCTKELNPYKLTWVGVEDPNGVWTPLIKGIPPTFYTGVANNGIPERYEIRQCIEVFPAPIEGYKLRIKGHFGLTAFVDGEDTTTIDSELVFLWALGTAKAHYGQPDANSLKSEANIMLGDLVAGSHQTARYVPATWNIPPWTRPLFLPLEE